ncbi:hypothetical protein [Riemerella anatipestifer]|uniref:Lipoprotein n=1 Tax=Riemerella anatipestifer TaxID=34085 RepID=A0A1S7DPC2_RIEAN|nr:hypothetical protein [Riemerella anatipestifer]AQY20975.1 hypothetical protein AB406_0009 [Riemerella anatipestifer]
MKNLIISLIILMIVSCKDKNEKLIENNIPIVETKETKIKEETDTTKIADEQNEVMTEKDILFNGKLKRYFSLKEFENVFGKADSIKPLAEEEPCTFIFDTELEPDNSNFNEFMYYYKDASRFENYKEKVAVDEFRFINNNFILFKGIKLNSSTTVKDLKKLFPNAMKNIGTMDVYGEGNLQVIQLREDEHNVSDGHINLFIKNGKLYYIHWWFPC